MPIEAERILDHLANLCRKFIHRERLADDAHPLVQEFATGGALGVATFIWHQLLDRPNVVVTPHVASASVAGRRRLYEHSIENALAVLEGKPASRVIG